MDVYQSLLLTLTLVPALALAQTTATRTLRSFGQADVTVRPDQARVQIAITTRAATADQASQQNATTSTAVFDAIKGVLGASGGEIKSSYYNLSPVYEGTPPRQVGFEVTNAVLVTVNNLNITGRVIDTAIQAGATRIMSLTLGLQNDDPPRNEALRAAGQKARAKAESIALGLAVRIGQVVHAEEGYSAIPIPVDVRAGGAMATSATPIEGGAMTVTATITVDYELLP